MIKFRKEDRVKVISGMHKGCTAEVLHPMTRRGDEDILVRIRLDSKSKSSDSRTTGVYQYRLVLTDPANINPNFEFKRRKMGGVT